MNNETSSIFLYWEQMSILALLTWEKLPECSAVLPFMPGLPWCRKVLSLMEMSCRFSVVLRWPVLPQLWPYGWVGWHDRICFQVCLQTGASWLCTSSYASFVQQTRDGLSFSEYRVVQSPAWSSSLNFVWNTLCLLVFPPLASLKGPPHSALRRIVCAKLICPVHTFPIWILDPLPPLPAEI